MRAGARRQCLVHRQGFSKRGLIQLAPIHRRVLLATQTWTIRVNVYPISRSRSTGRVEDLLENQITSISALALVV